MSTRGRSTSVFPPSSELLSLSLDGHYRTLPVQAIQDLESAPLNILRNVWGYASFRPLQEEIIHSVLAGKDTLALLPTGGGKSICYQVPALAREGLCLVISPLIALMNDQVSQLRKRGVEAVAIHSGLGYRDIDRAFDNAVFGNTKLLYLSPERLITELARERIARMQVNMLAVDEAHCISQWGYDFRPSYLEIAAIRDLLPDIPVLALTATATPKVVADIQEKLNFEAPNVLSHSFQRPELSYVVLREEDRQAKMLDILTKVPGSAIIYLRSRRRTREIANFLQRRGINADFYHAGLNPVERNEKQEAWTKGNIRVMACTNAFGMGIDKPDVRSVIHLELPDSLEAYFQEAGRAGRDGERAYATLIYQETDRHRLERFHQVSFPDLPFIRQVYRALGSYFQLAVGAGEGRWFDFDLVAFTQTYRFDPLPTFHALRRLEQSGWIALTEAVFQPATIEIRVGREQLYDYQLRNPRKDKIVKALLRNYQGAFSGLLSIREGQLANLLGMDRLSLKKAFAKLQQDGIIYYSPQSEKPKLIFLRERVDADNLDIDFRQYELLRKRDKERIRAAIAYAETPECRSKQLLAYFGENDAPECGQCDICLGRNREELSAEEYARLQKKIKMVLQQEELPAQDVIRSFSPAWQKRVTRAIEDLLDEGKVILKSNRLAWKG